jgi:hypothetical protein
MLERMKLSRLHLASHAPSKKDGTVGNESMFMALSLLVVEHLLLTG